MLSGCSRSMADLSSWIGSTLTSTLSRGPDLTVTTDSAAPFTSGDDPDHAALAGGRERWPAWELVPGVRLGELELGASAWTVTSWLQAQLTPLQLDIEYEAASRSTLDLCLTLRRGEPAPGRAFCKLHFGGPRQRLSLIELVDLGVVELTYGGEALVSLPAFAVGAESAEPALDMRRLAERLREPGLGVEEQANGGFTHWVQGIAAWPSPSNADGVERLALYHSGLTRPQELIHHRQLPPAASAAADLGADSSAAGSAGAGGGSAAAAAATAVTLLASLDKSVSVLTVLPEDVSLQVGMEAQAVLAAIGPPGEEYDGPRGGQHELFAASQGHYVHNYFQRGFDVMYGVGSHAVVGFVMHTNFAAHQTFGVYERCCFTIIVPDDDGQQRCLHPESTHAEALALLGPPTSPDGQQGHGGHSNAPDAIKTLAALARDDPLAGDEAEVVWWRANGLVMEFTSSGGSETAAGGAGRRPPRCLTTVTVLPQC